MSDSSSSDSSSSSEEKKKKKKKDKKKEKKKKDKKKDKKKKKDPGSGHAYGNLLSGSQWREKARLEAQQRLMGIDTNKKPKKKKKKPLGRAFSQTVGPARVADEGQNMIARTLLQMLQRTVHLRQAEASGTAYARFHFLNSHLGSVAESTFVKTDRLEDQTLKREVELAEEAEKAAEPVPEKSWEEMTWSERAAAAAQKAEAEAIWKGASKADARRVAARASDEVLLKAADDGFVQTLPQRARFNAATGTVSRGG
ncbi:unnamed protein product [Symbiodinium natans]|uniref:Uncharacterized protein n=1 Tax=Symbiodinium natans TaxID=878477 RepID=A0A812SYJ4_9DINO|nr:unnamed protein product [Symbiodinium natans]